MVDSGCTVHLVKDISLMDPGSVNQASGSLCLADGKKIQISAMGKRSMEVGGHRIELQKVYYAEAVRQNLFSVKAVMAEGALVTLGEKEAYVTKGNLKINLSRGEDAWYLPITNEVGRIMSVTAPWGLWHERMGHPGSKKLKSLAKRGYIHLTGKRQEREDCEPCLLSKPRNEIIPRHATYTKIIRETRLSRKAICCWQEDKWGTSGCK